LLNTPSSWKHPRWYSYLLAPLGWLWFLFSKLRNLIALPYKSAIPVICVGNHLIGGAGKTPCVIALAKLLTAMDKNVVCVSKGYGGSIKKPTIVEPEEHSASDVGDEPLLLAAHVTTVVAKNRVKGIKFAEILSPDVIILDDGYQNPGFVKDVSVLLANEHTPYDNHFLFPVGPCREPLSAALERADMVVMIGSIKNITLPGNTFPATITPLIKRKPTGTYLAFSGIGYPEKFFATAEKAGYRLVTTEGFPDHYAYRKKDLQALFAKAKQLHAKLLTTEKDMARIPKKYHKKVEVLPIQLQWKSPDSITNTLKKKLG
jgi:tetraacyldisaccharide 4'-kinase